jgi:hypothetical protein
VQDEGSFRFDRLDTCNPFSTIRWIEDNVSILRDAKLSRYRLSDRITWYAYHSDSGRKWFRKYLPLYVRTVENLGYAYFTLSAEEIMDHLLPRLNLLQHPVEYTKSPWRCITIENGKFMSSEYSMESYKMKAVTLLNELAILGQPNSKVEIYDGNTKLGLHTN